MIAAVKQTEAGRKAEDVAREAGVSARTIYASNSKYGGMEVSLAMDLDTSFAGLRVTRVLDQISWHASRISFNPAAEP